MAKKKKAAKSKKASKKTVAKKTAAVDESAALDIAGSLKDEVTALLAGVTADLMRILKETEETVRAISFAESQIERQKDLMSGLSDEKTNLEAELDTLTHDNDLLRVDVDDLADRKKKATEESKSLQKQASSLKKETAKLETKNEKLSGEITSLEKSADRLKKDVERLESIRQDYLDRIAKFRDMREDLVR